MYTEMSGARRSPQRFFECPASAAAEAIVSFRSSEPIDDAYWALATWRRGPVQARHRPDPYLTWLNAKILTMAADGQLFRVSDTDDTIQLRLGWKVGDNLFWYVCSVHTSSHADAGVALPPTVLWKDFGTLITPRSFDDDPTVEIYDLAGVSHGDIVQIDVYRKTRRVGERAEDLDPERAIENGEVHLALRIPVPVIVR